MSAINKELMEVYQLLRKEKEYDLMQYKQKILQASLKDKKNEGVCWYPVVVSRSYYGTGEKLIWEIERTTDKKAPHTFQSGNLIRIFSNAAFHDGKKEVTGVINFLKKNDLMVVTLNSDDVPDWANSGKLGVDLLFDEASYREMENAQRRIAAIEEGRQNELKEILYGGKKASFRKISPASDPELNESQNQALNNILSANDIAIIHGPPGTGKTTTLVKAITYTLKSEKQVLVCAPSNAAVDLLVEKLDQAGISVVRIGHPARVEESILSKTVDAQISQNPHYRNIKHLRKKAEEFRRLAGKYKRNFGKAERQQRKLLYQEASRYLNDADMLEHIILANLFSEKQVIACTLVGSANQFLKGKTFSTVFIDEAAQALEPACWIPILKSERVIMAGDHHQLPPTIKSPEAAREGLSKTLFAKCMENQQVDKLLQTQYRMHEQIMGFSSAYFYENSLKADPGVADRRLLENEEPVLFIDIAGAGYQEQLNKESKSLENKEEAVLLLKHLWDYLEKITPERIMAENIQIGVISPYRAQASYLYEQVLNNLNWCPFLPYLTIDTVDAFQGRERDIIYISMVRSNTTGEIGFLKDIRRMNVAMTRARMKLVMVGDSATLCSYPFYLKLLDYMHEIEAYKSAFELMEW
ncbi:MAG: AAA domain-containing protein [Cyclobacteriaceae bacterium]